ncbi:hypothetical protein BGZ60DRAFT_431775 [Tricladium varicosporioides]|nr:hypothetical protein BGZ60DRAFT_431775 [Hymenoscyphus varicosporioides]
MKSLEETDFFRLNPRGDHIENWTSGIIGVIPDRDSHTLQKLDRYYILFSTPAAANRYLSNIIQLHQLARTSVQNGNAHDGLALPPGFLKHGEDVRGVLKGFSVVPPFTKLSCRLVSHPYPLPLQRLLENGGPAILARDKQSKMEEKVLFYTDTVAYGDLTLDTLYYRIKEDGRRRNLHWKLAGGKEDIHVLKEGHDQGSDEDHGTSLKVNRTPTRYVIPFTDRHEARRFVREWHRRELPLKKVYRPEDEPPPLVNAEVLW